MKNYHTDVEYETEEKKKFQITRGMVILAALILVILITIIIIIVVVVKSNNKQEYTAYDFSRLEARMIEEAPTYISQKQIILTDTEIRIDLKELLLENGGFIDSSKVRATKICDGYVIASKKESEQYASYIKCGNLYTTSGYVSNDNNVTTTTKAEAKDTIAPTITLINESLLVINVGSKFEDPGVTAIDNVDGDITSKVKVSGKVDTSKIGEYTIVYSVSDKAKNKSEVKRVVKVIPVSTTITTTKTQTTTRTTPKTTIKITTYKTITQKPTTPPTITLRGNKTITINVGSSYSDPGYSAVDSLGNNITSRVNVSGNVNTNNPGTYYITYSVTDSYRNKASVSRTIIVKSTTIALTAITLTPNYLELSPNTSKTLTVIYSPSNATDKTLYWSSNNVSVATVSNGTIYARFKGTAIITAKSSNGKTASVKVVVK